MEFKTIETQEQFDEMVRDRLSRQEAKIREEYADYSALKERSDTYESEKSNLENQLFELNEKIATYDTEKASFAEREADYTKQIEAYKEKELRMQVALESGLPLELSNKISGTTKEEMLTDATMLASFVSSKHVAPLRKPEAEESDGVMKAFKKLNPNLNI